MKVSVLTKFGALGASSRLRCLQYLPHLRQSGFEPHVFPLFNDVSLRKKYVNGRFSRSEVVAAVLGRVRDCWSNDRNSLLWIQKEVLPFAPAFVDGWLLGKRSRIVLDLDDAEFLKYGDQGGRLSRLVAGSKYRKLVERVDQVVVGSDELGEMLSDCIGQSSTPTMTIPTVVDYPRYERRTQGRHTSGLNLGWIGTPYTQHYVDPIIEALGDDLDGRNLSLTLIGSSNRHSGHRGIRLIDWSEATEVSNVQNFDVGLMPLEAIEIARGKCAYKAIQYMACGVPAIVSPVGANRTVVRDGVDGIHATSISAWLSAIEKLRDDPALRRAMGLQGRLSVQRNYSVTSQLPRLIEALTGVDGHMNREPADA